MPPKPRGSRRASAAKNTVSPAIASDQEKDDGNPKQDSTMPPPPVPSPPPLILEPEMNALSSCLKVHTQGLWAIYFGTNVVYIIGCNGQNWSDISVLQGYAKSVSFSNTTTFERRS